jgi:hypothetical protein
VIERGLSTRKASSVCASLAYDGVKLPTPSQSGIWRRVIKEGQLMKDKIKEVLINEKEFSLHFDGKKLDDQEWQVVCAQSPERQLKLGVVKCTSGSAQHIYEGIKALLDDYDAWCSIQMVVCDTTAVNTGRLNGVVTKIQNEMVKKGYPQPQYIGCQHHILDRVLKHVLDFFIKNKSQTPKLNYDFIDDVTQKYTELQGAYRGKVDMNESENPGWRDDFKFLFHLCNAFKFYKVRLNANFRYAMTITMCTVLKYNFRNKRTSRL